MINSNIKNINSLIDSNSGSIVITSHKNPDGDAIGSSLALYKYLTLKGHDVTVIIPNEFPGFLAWMKSSDRIVVYKREAKLAKKLIAKASIIFSLDYNAFHRAGDLKDQLQKVTGKRVLIDHHVNPDNSFDLLYSTTKTSSTAELVYNLIESAGDQKLIDNEIAEGLYVGIVTDTGSFSYSCNYSATYEAVAFLIGLGLDGEHIHHMLYDTFSEDRLNLLGYCLSKRLIVLRNYNTAYIHLSADDLDRFNFQIGDTEGVVNYALSINGINLAVLFTERDKYIRISFRSKDKFDVNIFAKKYFDGGGHKKAAGGSSYVSLEETIANFTELLELYKKELSS
ncbi:MAG: bifunctional oligoribonuclease/PAP phosphatase NrnA [Bacteroidetes bacterium]|nr:bifunctional oligoribonuclease/PAP phosphatase NrnA [Bacteroidota bacterium]